MQLLRTDNVPWGEVLTDTDGAILYVEGDVLPPGEPTMIVRERESGLVMEVTKEDDPMIITTEAMEHTMTIAPVEVAHPMTVTVEEQPQTLEIETVEAAHPMTITIERLED